MTYRLQRVFRLHLLLLPAQAGKTLVPLQPDGTPGPAIATSYDDGKHTIALSQGTFSHWYLLR